MPSCSCKDVSGMGTLFWSWFQRKHRQLLPGHCDWFDCGLFTYCLLLLSWGVPKSTPRLWRVSLCTRAVEVAFVETAGQWHFYWIQLAIVPVDHPVSAKGGVTCSPFTNSNIRILLLPLHLQPVFFPPSSFFPTLSLSLPFFSLPLFLSSSDLYTHMYTHTCVCARTHTCMHMHTHESN